MMAAAAVVIFAAADSSTSWMASKLAPYDLDVHSFASTGRGLRTLRDRAADELTLAVPDEDVVLSERVLDKSEKIAAAAKLAAEAGSPLTDELVLVCYIAHEIDAGTSYAQSLPANQRSGVDMTADERSLLPRCYARCAELTHDYALEQYALCVDGLRASGEELSLKDFLRAFTHVRARSVEVSAREVGALEPPSALLATSDGRRRALLPVLDLLNHRRNARTSLERVGGSWRLTSESLYAAGSQVYLSYGARDNLKLLLQYGFALCDNDDALIIFDVADLVDGCVAALPSYFLEVREILQTQLSDADTAGAADPLQRLALFSVDGCTGRPRENLQAALAMMEGLAPSLGATAEEAAGLPAEALRHMLMARRSEVEGCLEAVGALDAAGGRDDGGLRGATGTLLAAEREAIQRVLAGDVRVEDCE